MLRKILPLLVVGILVFSGLVAVALHNKDTIEFEKTTVIFSEPIIKDENEFVTITIEDTNSFIMNQGKPLLPSYTEKFTFPFGTKIKSVTANPKNIQTKTITKELMPTPQALVVGQIVAKSQDKAVDYGIEPYPKNWFTYDIGCGLINGELNIILDTEISPIIYQPKEKTIKWIGSIDISIEYEKPSKKQSNPEQYQFLIITADEFSDELTSLVTYKTEKGISTKLATLSEVYTGQGRDNQEKIKYFIKDAIENWDTTYVLIVGAWKKNNVNYQKFPVRETHIVSTDPEDDELFVSDLYYADIYNKENEFCDWDADGDDKFGEVLDKNNIDKVDLHPDVYLGRLPATSGSQVNTIINKIKTYETNEAYTKDWFTNIVVIGGDTSPGYDTLEGEYINQKVIDLMDGFSPTELWVSNGKLTKYLPKTGNQNIKDAINAGCGFVDFSGHGNTNVWATHPEDNQNIWVPTPYPPGTFSSSEIAILTNGDELPIVTVEACSTAKFYNDENTFNWAFLHNSNGGGIGAFGATALGWGYVGTGISQGLIGKMGLDTFRSYRYSGATTFGEMWGWALERYIKSTMSALDFKTAEEWIAFGDPTLQIAEETQPPSKPDKPVGPSSGKEGESFTYSSKAVDPDEDDVYLKFDWGDGTETGWLGPLNSGQTESASHTWNREGAFELKVAAKDIHGKISDWSNPLTVTITPKSKIKNTIFLHQFLENFPFLEKLLLLFSILTSY